MKTRTWFALLPCSLAVLGCDLEPEDINPVPLLDAAVQDSPAETSPDAADAKHDVDAHDAAEAGDGDAGPAKRTIVTSALFGDTQPENLFIDPVFSAYMPSSGNWMPMTADQSAQQGASFGAGMMSDSPVGISMSVGKLADATSSSTNYELTLIAQVPGGSGPYHVQVWLSTLDEASSSDSSNWTGVTVGLLVSEDSNIIPVSEATASKKVIKGRTWHLFKGDIAKDLRLGAFVALDFAASKNTWLVQAPEFVPVALLDSSKQSLSLHRPALAPMPLTPTLKRCIELYVNRPKPSVVPWHRLLRGRDPRRLRP